jgi:hypothetical protein
MRLVVGICILLGLEGCGANRAGLGTEEQQIVAAVLADPALPRLVADHTDKGWDGDEPFPKAAFDAFGPPDALIERYLALNRASIKLSSRDIPDSWKLL